MDAFIGEIRIFAGNYAPAGWAFCSGQLLSIAQNTALYSLLGVQYGGNGVTTFALPNLNGRFPLGAGQGPGLSPRPVGQAVGSAAVTLAVHEIPAHAHSVTLAGTGRATDGDPSGKAFAAADVEQYGPASGAAGMPMIAAAGGGQPHNNVSPYLGLSFIIALQGIYPSRQ